MTEPMESRAFELAVNGRPVHGVVEWAGSGDEARPFVVLVHGFRSSHSWGFFPELACRLVSAGFVCARFSMSGSGMSSDGTTFENPELFSRNTYSNELEDLAAVREHLCSGEYPVDPERGAVLGHSRGSGIALIHAAEVEGLRAVVGWATIVQAASWTEPKKARWHERGIHRVVAPNGEPIELALDILEDAERNRERLDMPAVARKTKTSTLLVHGTEDEGIALEAIRGLYRQFPPCVARLVEIGGAGHNFGVRHPMGDVPEVLELAIGATIPMLVSSCRPAS